MKMGIGSGTYQASQGNAAVACVPDAISFAEPRSGTVRFATMALAIAAGVAGGSILDSRVATTDALTAMFVVLALVGGFLSTWSPCGYSSLSLLRPAGRYSFGSVARWTPTFLTHVLGYAVGALVLGGALGFAGWLLFEQLPFTYMVAGMSVLAIGYGVHQFGFLKMPYPQRRAQVPHDARYRFSSWVIGLLYGFALGMNYLTYVQTPMLYIVTGVALFSGDVQTAITIFAIFNIGRCLPVAINFLPVSNQAAQAWLARWQERAVEVDGFLLLSIGSAALTLLFI
ncbi:methylamine utilization protein MauF [Methylotenera oryzisoli]|uniref:Methylamine utilization protein MauF n=1 Tax=Methylotenera oryzisoli TaxID=2080758 RepID=A0A4Y9VRJ0_9PROT|nr:methylamine utilization protein MauF [Methylotenera oryzisoli]TFW70807.1 methylamine utilization protein MauF [Methylotenera oryzisoli]